MPVVVLLLRVQLLNQCFAVLRCVGGEEMNIMQLVFAGAIGRYQSGIKSPFHT